MKISVKLFLPIVVAAIIVACGQSQGEQPVEARAVFDIDRVYINEQQTDIASTPYYGSTLIFIGPENGGSVLIIIGNEDSIFASINPSRDHPSFAAGYWHHHLYAGSSTAGSPRINFANLLPELGIDIDPQATDNTQSSYQRGNLHYIIETGEFRLRFPINNVYHDLIFLPRA